MQQDVRVSLQRYVPIQNEPQEPPESNGNEPLLRCQTNLSEISASSSLGSNGNEPLLRCQTNLSEISASSLLELNVKHANRFDTPANWKIAQERGNQRIIASDPNRRLGICSNSNEFAYYRISYELYLDFIKRLIWIVIGLILLTVAWKSLEYLLCGSSAWSLQENELSDCSYFVEISLIKVVTNVAFMHVVRIILNRLDNRRKIRYQTHFKLRRLSEKNYCFLVKNIAPQTTADELRAHIEDNVIRQKCIVRDIFFLKDTTMVNETVDQLQESSLTQAIDSLGLELFNSYDDSQSPYFNGCAIIYFHHVFMAHTTLKILKKSRVRSEIYFHLRRCCDPNYRKEVYFKNRLIEAWELEDPSDVIWNNIHHSVRSGQARTAFAYFCMCLFLVGFLYLDYYFTTVTLENSSNGFKVFAFSLALVANGYVMKILIQIFAAYIKVPGELTKVRFEFAISILLSYLAYSLAYLILKIRFGEKFLLASKALETIGLIFLSASFNGLAPFSYIVKSIRRCVLRLQGPRNTKMQFQADEIFTNPEISMQDRVNLLCQPVFLAITVYMKYPLALVGVLLVLIANFYIDKYNIIYRWRIMKRRTPEIAYKIYLPLSFDILILTQANVLFVFDLNESPQFREPGSNPWSFAWSALVLNILFTAIYYYRRYHLSRLEKAERKMTLNTMAQYDVVKSKFLSTYKSTYPYLIQKN